MKPLLITLLIAVLLYPVICSTEENRLAISTRQTQTMYVDDELWITIRSEPDADSEKIAVIKSGLKMSILSYEDGADYAKVHTDNDYTGWVLYRYLSPKPPATLRLEQTEALLAELQTKQNELNTTLTELKSTNRKQSEYIHKLEGINTSLEAELNQLRTVSEDAVRNFELTETLMQQSNNAETQLAALEKENKSLSANLIWLAIGAAVAGLLAGLFLGTIPLRRDKRWRSMP